jgi:hypothetical protein
MLLLRIARRQVSITLHRFCWTALLLLLLVPALDEAKGKKNKKDKGTTAATQADYDALVRLRVVTGKLTSVEGSSKGFTLQYEYPVLAATNKAAKGKNQAYTARLRKLAQKRAQIARITDPGKRLRRLQRLAQLEAKFARGQAKASKVTTARKDFNLQAIEEVKVRLMQLPVEYDDKGHVKKYTAKEKKELRGKDLTLPGYTGSWDQVSAGQTVKVYLLPKKKKPAADKGKGEDKEVFDLLEENRPLVKMIVILAEPEADAAKSK